jgi:cysteine desulfurase
LVNSHGQRRAVIQGSQVRLRTSLAISDRGFRVAVPGTRGLDVLAICPAIAASSGSVCHTGQIDPSAALVAMGVSAETAAGAIRLSSGRHTTSDQVSASANAITAATATLTA